MKITQPYVPGHHSSEVYVCVSHAMCGGLYRRISREIFALSRTSRPLADGRCHWCAVATLDPAAVEVG